MFKSLFGLADVIMTQVRSLSRVFVRYALLRGGEGGERWVGWISARVARLLGALTTDPRVRGSSPWHGQTFTQSEESR